MDIKAPNGCFWRLVLPAAVDKAATYNMLAGDKVLHIETFEELEEVCFLDSKTVGTVRALRARSGSAQVSSLHLHSTRCTAAQWAVQCNRVQRESDAKAPSKSLCLLGPSLSPHIYF